MITNKEWAKDKYKNMRMVEFPFLLAYWESDKLLLHKMNDQAFKLFGYPAEEKNDFLNKYSDSSIEFLLKSEFYESMVQSTMDGETFAARLECRKGDRSVEISSYREGSFGAVFKISGGSRKWILPSLSPESIDAWLKSYIKLFKTSRVILMGVSSTIVGLFGVSFIGPWAIFEPIQADATKESTVSNIERIISSEINKLPRFDSRIENNGVTVSKYLNNLKSRQLYAGEIEGISILNKQALDVKSTSEDGWRQQLIAHAGDSLHPFGQMHIMDKAEFQKKDPNHSVAVALGAGGVSQVATYPIYTQDGDLSGYVAIGLKNPLTVKQLPIIRSRLKTISSRISMATTFPD